MTKSTKSKTVQVSYLSMGVTIEGTDADGKFFKGTATGTAPSETFATPEALIKHLTQYAQTAGGRKCQTNGRTKK